MKIVIDDKIPFLKGVLEPFAKVQYLNGEEICQSKIVDADGLIIRTRTKVSKDLLGNTSVRYVGSATIGTDHIDTDWCDKNGIYWESAPGCNSGSVMQYVSAALARLQSYISYNPTETTIGIIGVGNVGKKVASMARVLGYNVLLNDPPRARAEGDREFVSLEYLLRKSDIISLHVPLIKDGLEKTYHLIDSSLLKQVIKEVILINTSRGDVIQEEHLIQAIESKKVRAVILDVWKNEPLINRELLKRSFIATPHIAGYSVDGKIMGTTMILKSIVRFFNISLNVKLPVNIPPPENKRIYIEEYSGNKYNIINRVILQSYPIDKDHQLLISNPEYFEKLRNNYRIRREFGAYEIEGGDEDLARLLKDLGFK